MQVLGSDEVHRLLDYPGLIAALRSAHAVDTMPLSRMMVLDEPRDGANNFVSLVAWAAGDMIAVKLVGVFPGNLSMLTPQPSVQGLVALFSGTTGRPLFICDGAALTFRKTAADSGLGASFLARQDAETLLVVGAGGLAPHVMASHKAARPSIRHVMVWNRSPARAEALARETVIEGAEIRAVTDLDAAVAEADVISCVTLSKAPLVKGARLKPGTHVDLIGAYRPEMREADDDVVRRARIFVDTRNNCDQSGDIADPLASGLMTPQSIEADLFDLCAGRNPGRRDAEEITMYKNVGGAHLDLFTARHLMAAAGR